MAAPRAVAWPPTTPSGRPAADALTWMGLGWSALPAWSRLPEAVPPPVTRSSVIRIPAEVRACTLRAASNPDASSNARSSSPRDVPCDSPINAPRESGSFSAVPLPPRCGSASTRAGSSGMELMSWLSGSSAADGYSRSASQSRLAPPEGMPASTIQSSEAHGRYIGKLLAARSAGHGVVDGRLNPQSTGDQVAQAVDACGALPHLGLAPQPGNLPDGEHRVRRLPGDRPDPVRANRPADRGCFGDGPHVDGDRRHGEDPAVRPDRDHSFSLDRDRDRDRAFSELGVDLAHAAGDGRPHLIRVDLCPVRGGCGDRVPDGRRGHLSQVRVVGRGPAAAGAHVHAENGARHPLTAPSSNPDTNQRCTATNSRINGAATKVRMANSAPGLPR